MKTTEEILDLFFGNCDFSKEIQIEQEMLNEPDLAEFVNGLLDYCLDHSLTTKEEFNAEWDKLKPRRDAQIQKIEELCLEVAQEALYTFSGEAKMSSEFDENRFTMTDDDLMIQYCTNIEYGAIALGELYKRHYDQLFFAAYGKTHSKEDSEDVIHDVFEKLLVTNIEIRQKYLLKADGSLKVKPIAVLKGRVNFLGINVFWKSKTKENYKSNNTKKTGGRQEDNDDPDDSSSFYAENNEDEIGDFQLERYRGLENIRDFFPDDEQVEMAVSEQGYEPEITIDKKAEEEITEEKTISRELRKPIIPDADFLDKDEMIRLNSVAPIVKRAIIDLMMKNEIDYQEYQVACFFAMRLPYKMMIMKIGSIDLLKSKSIVGRVKYRLKKELLALMGQAKKKRK